MADNFDALVLDGLVNHFSLEELQTLCFRLDVNPDRLKHDNLDVLARELIAYMRRNGRLNDLIAQLRREREHVSWSNAPAETIHRPDIPRQLPPAATHFTGRGLELEQLLAALQPGHMVTLYGPGGIGKTALAAEALHALFPLPLGEGQGEGYALFPGGVLFHSFYGRPAAAECAAHVARSYNIDPNPDPSAAMAAALHNRVALLVLDGTEETDDLEALLERRGGCGVLITSRRRADVKDVGIEVERLPHTDALALLRALAGEQVDDETAATEICELCGNLPLALRLAGAFMFREGQSAVEYLTWLRETPLQALDFGARRRESVDVLLAKSVAQVSDVARGALAVAGCLALQPFDVAPVAAALGLSNHAVRRALGELVNYELLRRPGERYETTHVLIHGYARERLPVEPDALRRLGEYYAALVEAESASGVPGFRRLDPERGHILTVLQQLAVDKEWEVASGLVWKVAGYNRYLDLQGHPLDRIAALEVGLMAARGLHNLQMEGHHLTHLGMTYAAIGQVKRAVKQYEAALAIAREIGDRYGEANRLGNLGNVYADMGQLERSMEYYEAALAVDRETGDRRQERADLDNLGTVYRILGQVEQAVAYHEEALNIAREVGDRRGEGFAQDHLGIDCRNLGQVERAIAEHEEALATAREIGDRRLEGIALGNLGQDYAAMGHVEQAKDYYQAVLALDREVGNRRWETVTLGYLGNLYDNVDQLEQAIEYYELALAISSEIGDRRREGNQLGSLGNVHYRLGQVERAIECYESALTIAREIGDRQNEGTWLSNLGAVYGNLGQLERAIGFYEAALAVARETGNRLNEGNWLYNLGLALEQLERKEEAISSFKQALAIYEAIKDPNAEKAHEQLARLRGDG
jgi:tetratricopeptide (TPR) repeat protein